MKVRFRPRAEDDLNRLYDYIAAEANADIAFEFVWKLRSLCLSLDKFPYRGRPRDDIRKGLRILTVQRRSVIAYEIRDEVEIIAVFHAGQNWMASLQNGDLL